MATPKEYVGTIDGVGRFVFPLLGQISKTRYELLGSASIFTVAGRFFFITAAHVANNLKDMPAAIRTPGRYIHLDLKLGQTTGDDSDTMDIALNEIHPNVVAEGNDFCRVFDLPDVTQDFVPKPGHPYTFVGYPQSVNKSRVRFGEPAAQSMQQLSHVARDHAIYSKGDYEHHNHIICAFDPEDRYIVGGEKKRSHLPQGISGGLVMANDPERLKAGEIAFKGIIGIPIEYRRDFGVLVGVHIGAVFDLLRSLWPELRDQVPRLHPNGTWHFGR